jgi:hypothetical protein
MKSFSYENTYDEMMDNECVKICNYLNSLPSVKTFCSCCGHGIEIFSLFFECTDRHSLSFLGRCIDENYFEYGNDIEIRLTNSDINTNSAVFELHTITSKGNDAYKKIESLCENMLVHINHKNYMNYFIPDCFIKKSRKNLKKEAYLLTNQN